MSLSFQSIFMIAPRAENYFVILSKPYKTTSFHVYAFSAKNSTVSFLVLISRIIYYHSSDVGKTHTKTRRWEKLMTVLGNMFDGFSLFYQDRDFLNLDTNGQRKFDFNYLRTSFMFGGLFNIILQ